MIDPVEIKVCGTCTDLLSFAKVFESVHRLAVSHSPGFKECDRVQKFDVMVTYSDTGSSVSVTPVAPVEGNS